MKLSEAIKLGALMRGRGTGVDSFYGYNNVTCAMGAALDALGVTMQERKENKRSTYERWPWISQRQTCPDCGKRAEVVYIIATHLNDDHGWTRERIADWVATVEPAEVPQPGAAVAEGVAP
jgi:hypothetical protein